MSRNKHFYLNLKITQHIKYRWKEFFLLINNMQLVRSETWLKNFHSPNAPLPCFVLLLISGNVKLKDS